MPAHNDLSYIINQLGEERARYEHAVAPPIWQTSIFAHPTVAALRAAMADEFAHHLYTRGNNPTVEILCRKLAALEGAESALAFGSGAAAMSTAIIGSVRAGDHVLCVAKPYSWTRTLIRTLLAKFGVTHDFIDARDSADVAAALRERTRLIVLESPNTFTFEQQDLAAIAQLARARGIRTLCDNSYATPLGQSPIALGIDLVAHSATKYLNGHADVVAGVLCGTEALMRELFSGPYMTLGAMLSPHDAWLLIRGLRTLPVRLERIAATTAQVVAFLRAQPRVRVVHYPQDDTYPQRALTQKQLKHASGMVSVELDTDQDGIERFCDGLERFLMAVSWGGYESLVFPIAGVRDWRGYERQSSVPVNLVRFSIGLEEPQVLIDDLRCAFARL